MGASEFLCQLRAPLPQCARRKLFAACICVVLTDSSFATFAFACRCDSVAACLLCRLSELTVIRSKCFRRFSFQVFGGPGGSSHCSCLQSCFQIRFLGLQEDIDPSRRARAAPGQALVVSEPLTFQSPWRAFSSLSFDAPWTVEAFTIRARKTLQGLRDWSPSRIVAIRSRPPTVFWKGKCEFGADEPAKSSSDLARGSASVPSGPSSSGSAGPDTVADAPIADIDIDASPPGEQANESDADDDGEDDGLAFLRALEAAVEEAGVFEEEGEEPCFFIGGVADVVEPPRPVEPVPPAGAPGTPPLPPPASCSGGAASSAGSAVVAMPPPPVPPVGVARRARARTVDAYPRLNHPLHPGPKGDHTLRLVENPRLGVRDMKAFCGYHETCTLTRSCVDGPASFCQGRPIGFLWLWLTLAGECPTKLAHTAAVKTLVDLYRERVLARESFLIVPGSAAWVAAEDPPSDPARPEPLKVR
jgi:hypothetical protein